MTSDIREEIEAAIRSVLWNASNYPKKVQPSVLGQDIRPLVEKAADAILASPLLRRIRAEAWDEGFDKGHYVNAEESRDCGCNTNPYREEEA